MKLIACDPIMGLPRLPIEGLHPDKADLLSEMKRLRIDLAVVRHQVALDAGPVAGNRAVREEIAAADPLIAAWFVTPDGFEPDFDPAKMLDDMLGAGIALAWTDAESQDFSLLPWCSGELYEQLQSRQIPLLLDHHGLNHDDLHVVLRDFPRLRVALVNMARTVGRNRLLYPLLRRHPNLYLCLNNSYAVHQGIEDLCDKFGSQRWVFGMGYPRSEGGASITGLMYADISDEQRADIAHRTIERGFVPILVETAQAPIVTF